MTKPKPCGCTDLILCDIHMRTGSGALASALAKALFGVVPVDREARDDLAFSQSDAVYLKKLRISPK